MYVDAVDYSLRVLAASVLSKIARNFEKLWFEVDVMMLIGQGCFRQPLVNLPSHFSFISAFVDSLRQSERLLSCLLANADFLLVK